jgi:Hypothetical glycosyl hydrolase family 15
MATQGTAVSGAPARLRKPRRLALALAAVAVGLAALPAIAHAGEIRLVRNANSSFDGFITQPPPEAQHWMRKHYFQMRGYAPYFDDYALPWSPPPASFYRDLYAIYDSDVIADHPSWVLRDGAGRPLYIPFGCSGGTCPQYAADFGNPGFRSWWIENARETFDYSDARSPDGSGYDGLFIDDVNLEFRVGNGNGDAVTPIDPRTGGPMTEQNWQRYMVEFLEQIRNAFPDAQITHNAVWWLPHSDREVRREVGAADVIELERGFNDPGLTKGKGKYGYSTLMRHVDWLHGRGKSVVLEPYLENERQASYELASYLLVRKGKDAIASDFRTEPPVAGEGGDWWRRWSTNPGGAHGPRHDRKGLWRREFSRGTAVVNRVGGKPRTVRFKRPRRSLTGKVSRRFRLAPREGDFFRKAKRR